MSSIIKKSSSRFTPKVTRRKQVVKDTDVRSATATPTPAPESTANTPVPEKQVPSLQDAPVEIMVEKEKAAAINLKQDIFKTNAVTTTATSTVTAAAASSVAEDEHDNDEEAIAEEEEDPKKKASTVIINPAKLSNEARRSSSTLSTVGSGALRRTSFTDDNRRIRRLSSITTGLGSGLASLRRPSAVGSPHPSTAIKRTSVAEESTAEMKTTEEESVTTTVSAEPFRIDIPSSSSSSKRTRASAKAQTPKPSVKRAKMARTAPQEAEAGAALGAASNTSPDVSNEVAETRASTVESEATPVPAAAQEAVAVAEVVAEKTEARVKTIIPAKVISPGADSAKEMDSYLAGTHMEAGHVALESGEATVDASVSSTTVSTAVEQSNPGPESQQDEAANVVNRHHSRGKGQRTPHMSFRPRDEQKKAARDVRDINTEKDVVGIDGINSRSTNANAKNNKRNNGKSVKKEPSVMVVVNEEQNSQQFVEKILPKLDDPDLETKYSAIVGDDNKITFVNREEDDENKFSKVRKIESLSSIPRAYLSENHKLFQNFVIDEEKFTMAELCNNIFPIGEVSENFEIAKVAAERKKEAAAKRRQIREAARAAKLSYEAAERAKEEERIADRKRELATTISGFEESQSQSQQSAAKIQLQMGKDNQLMIDENSTQWDRNASSSANDNREKITENEFENTAISSTYGKRRVTDRWKDEELKVFYKALAMWGTDFNIITQYFPYRTRRQVKLKFNLEEKKNPYLVEVALANKLPMDFDKYCESTNQNYKTLEEYNLELREMREKHDKQVKEMQEAQKKQKEEDMEQQRAREVELRTGVKALPRSVRAQQLRQNETVVGEIKKQ